MKAIDSDKNTRERCVAKWQEAIMSYKRGVRVGIRWEESRVDGASG